MSRLFASASSQGLEIAGTALVTAYPLTMAAWFKPTTSTATGVMVSIGRTVTASHYWAIGVTSSAKPFLAARTGGTEADAIHGTSVTNGTWGHICGVLTSATNRDIYFNGGTPVNDATNTVAPVTPNTTNIGCLTSNTRTSFANGTIAHAAIWNVALMNYEVAALARGIPPIDVRPGNLIAYADLYPGIESPETDILRQSGWALVASPTQGTDEPLMVQAIAGVINNYQSPSDSSGGDTGILSFTERVR